MYTEFSNNYYIGQLYVETHDGDHAVLDCEKHKEANERIYAAGDGLDRLDQPLVMKVDESHFPVFSAEGMPTNTLGLPNDLFEATRIDNPPKLKEVLVAKADRAVQLLELFTAYTVNKPDYL